MNSVYLIPTDIHQNEFEVDGGNFDPLKLDFDNPDRLMLMVCLLLNLTIKIYGSEMVENVFLRMYLLFPTKLNKKQNKKKCNFQLKYGDIFTYLKLNDLIEISCVCKDFYQLCAKNRFYVKKFNQKQGWKN